MAITKVEKINDRELLVTSDTGGKSIVVLDNKNSHTEEYLQWKQNGGIPLPKPDWEPTLELAKSRRIREIKREARTIMMGNTDWYVIRKAETGSAIPVAVQTYRAALRQATTDSETAINALTTIDVVRDYKPVWPNAVE